MSSEQVIIVRGRASVPGPPSGSASMPAPPSGSAAALGLRGEKGDPGTDGDDGYSPVVTVTEIAGGHRVTITDEEHPSGQSFDVMNGVSPEDPVLSVNSKTGNVQLDASDVGALPSDTDLDDIPDGATYKRATAAQLSQIATNAEGIATLEAGAVRADIVQDFDSTAQWRARRNIGAYQKPSGGIPASDLASAVQTSLGKADTSLQNSVKGTANGVAELDANGKVPSSQLPSYVDDVIEGYYYNSKFYSDSAHTTEITGESGKIYVDKSTDKTYRWGGTAYAEISASIALGETSSTAYRGDRGKTAYDHSQLTSGNPHNVSKSDVGLGNVDNTSDATKKTNMTGTIADGNTGFVTGDAAYDALAGKAPRSAGLYYGKCTTAAGTQAKAVTINGVSSLTTGTMILVWFQYAQTYNGVPTLNVNSLGAKNIGRVSGTNAGRYEWVANEILLLMYDGTRWVIADGGLATTSYYGITLLQNSATSTKTDRALTPAALNSLWQNLISNTAAYSSSATYAVGDMVRYSFNLWTCATEIETAEAWTEAHWTKVAPIIDLIDAKYTKPSGGIPKTDLASSVQTSLGKADTALQSVPSAYRTAAAQDVIDAGKISDPGGVEGQIIFNNGSAWISRDLAYAIRDVYAEIYFITANNDQTEYYIEASAQTIADAITSCRKTLFFYEGSDGNYEFHIQAYDTTTGLIILTSQSGTYSTQQLTMQPDPSTSYQTMVGTMSSVDTGEGKYEKPSSGIPATDLASDVQATLGKDFVFRSTDQTIAGQKTFAEPPVLSRLYEGRYQQVAYLSGNGTPYINTGKPVHLGWRYRLDFQQNNTGQYRIWGAFNQQSYNGGLNASLTYSVGWTFRWETVSGQQREVQLATIDANRHVVEIINGHAYIDGVYKGISAAHNASVVSTYNAYLFTINPGGTTPTTTMNGKVYAYRVWDSDGNLVQDLIPCRDTVNSVNGMYDRVSGAFLTNANSSGAFTVGADVTAASPFGAVSTLEKVASTGLYADLSGRPALATVATSGSYNDLSNKPTIPGAYTSNPAALGTASPGNATTWARGNHVHPKPSPADIGAEPAVEVITVSGSTPSITAVAGKRYVCGEVSTLTIVVPASGIIDVIFESGTTATVLTITPATGHTVSWANGFDPTSLDASTKYELNIMDDLGVAASWN